MPVNETGHAVNVTNHRTLTNYVTTLGASYAPSNTAISAANLALKYTSADNANKAVAPAYLAVKTAQNSRKIIFDPVEERLTRSMGSLRSSGATPEAIDDAYTLVKKYKGIRTSVVVLDDPNTPEDESTISASHQSFIKKAETLNEYNQFISTVSQYNPAEANITIAALTAIHTNMETANNAFGALLSTWATTRQTRNVEIYHPTTGVVQLSKLVKEYLKSKFGTTSQTYKTANAIKFKTLIKVLP